MTRLTSWSICTCDSTGYLAPEIAGYALTGFVSGHPKKPDGMLVTTSRIISIDGRKVVTANTTYELVGDPAQHWLTWLADNGYQYDPENPAQPKRVEAAE